MSPVRRVAALVALLIASCVLLPPGASQSTEAPPADLSGSFSFDATAVAPGTSVQGELVLATGAEPASVRGAVHVTDRTARTNGQGLAPEGRSILDVEEDLAPFSERRVPFPVSVDGVGTVRVSFRVDDASSPLRVPVAQLTGLAPLDVSWESPGDAALVATPDRPAWLDITLAARQEGLTNLTLTVLDAVDHPLGDVAVGVARSARVDVHAEALGTGPLAVAPARILPTLSGELDGVPFSHPLHVQQGDEWVPLEVTVFAASRSALVAVPPESSRIGQPVRMDVLAVNTEDRARAIAGRIVLSIDGLPEQTLRREVLLGVEGNSVVQATLEWTPGAAGPWTVQSFWDGGDEVRSDVFRVAGPLADVRPQPRDGALRLGDAASVEYVVEASEDVWVERLTLVRPQWVQADLLGMDQILQQEDIERVRLDAGASVTVPLTVVPRATGVHSWVVVVETSDGPSVHEVASLTVLADAPPAPLPWVPVLIFVGLLALHALWRRSWVR